MKVRAVVSFSDESGRFIRQREVFDLPADVDWLQAGLVVPVPETGAETATLVEPEKRKRTNGKAKGKDAPA